MEVGAANVVLVEDGSVCEWVKQRTFILWTLFSEHEQKLCAASDPIFLGITGVEDAEDLTKTIKSRSRET